MARVIERYDIGGLAKSLRRAYEEMTPGDVLLLDVPGHVSGDGTQGATRDALATALFRAGFRKAANVGWPRSACCRAKRGRWLGALLPAKALGAGPDEYRKSQPTLFLRESHLCDRASLCTCAAGPAAAAFVDHHASLQRATDLPGRYGGPAGQDHSRLRYRDLSC